MLIQTTGTWAALRWLAAFVVALGPALVPAQTYAAPTLAGHPAPKFAPLPDAPQPGPAFTVNKFTDTTDGECSEDHCTLREAVLAANALPGADEIILPEGTYVLDLVGADEDAAATGDLDLTEDLTLTGVTSATTIISGTSAAFGDRLFEITNTAMVSISNVALTGGYVSGDGGAVLNGYGLALTDSHIYSNTSTQDGGGLYNSISGTVAISLSQFTNNLAVGFGGGGGLYTLGAATVYSTTFISNTARNGGGLASGPPAAESASVKLVAIEASTFLSNTAVSDVGWPYDGGSGGGVYLNGVMTVTNSLFAGNQAGRGGGLLGTSYSSRLTISGSTFISNTAGAGGGVWSIGTLDMQDSVLSHNHSTFLGGGLVSGTPLTLTRAVIRENSTAMWGGGIYVGSFTPPGLIRDSTIISNTASDGGGIYTEAYDLEVSASLIASNTATNKGGGVQSDMGLTLTNVQVINNQAANGGGLAAGRGPLMGPDVLPVTIDASSFLSNTASLTTSFTSGYGGGIYLNGVLTLTNSLLAGNRADSFGGGLSTFGSATVYSSTFTGNTARDGGGLSGGPVPVLISGTLTIEASTFLSNSAVITNAQGGAGGGLFVEGIVTLTNSLVVGNTASQDGGGLYSSISGTVAISLTQFTSNLAGGFGGGMDTLGSATVYSSTFISNTARNGGGLAGGPASEFTLGTLTIEASTFLSNSAITGTSSPTGGFGGGLFVEGILTLKSSLLSGNYAAQSGGAVNAYWYFNAYNSVIQNNRAGDDGGGLYLTTLGELNGLQIISNTAGDEGGGLFNCCYMTLSNIQVISNSAAKGGGILNNGGLTMTAGSVVSNTAEIGGGLNNYTLLNLTGTVFAHNHATLLGGGLSNYAPGSLTLSHATLQAASFLSNTSDFGGGLFNSGYLTLTAGLFDGNTATKTYIGDGGGLANASSGLSQLPFTVLISGTTFEHNSAFNGGGLINSDRPMELINTNFISNTASSHGGGLALGINGNGDPVSATASITGSLFSGNIATGTGEDGGGGGIYNSISGTVTLSATDFIHNSASDDGGGVYSEGYFYAQGGQVLSNTSLAGGGGWNINTHTEAEHVTFANNTAADLGGAIFISGDGWLTDTTVISNSAATGGGIFATGHVTLTGGAVLSNTANEGGGLVNWYNLVVSGTLFANNTGQLRGGGLSNRYPFGWALAHATIRGASFISNTGGFGGGLFNSGGLTLTDSLFEGNRATPTDSGDGGGLAQATNGFIFPTAIPQLAFTALISNTTFHHNSATGSGGGLINVEQTMVLINVQVISNTAAYGGGGMNGRLTLPPTTTAQMTITGGLFEANDAVVGGGLVNAYNGALHISGSSVLSNTGLSSGLANAGRLTLADSVVSYNNATGLTNDISGTATITDTTFAYNAAVGLANAGALTVTNSSFLSNTTPANGGGLYNIGSALIAGGYFFGNTASEMGGGLYALGPTTIYSSTFTGNTAASGGGLAVGLSGSATVSASALMSNTADYGGGITNQGTLDMADSSLTHNHAIYDGGGLASGNTLTLTRVLIAENRADLLYAGGLFVGGFSASNLIRNSAILSNTAPEGAGLYSEADYLTVLTTTIAGNTATGRGGGVFVDNVLTMTNVTVSGNAAGSHGGGIAAINEYAFSNTNLRLNNVTVANNTTTSGDGGGVYAALTATVRLTNTLLAGNVDSGGQAPDCAGPLSSGGYNLVSTTVGCTLGGSLTGVVSNTAALLGPLADNGGSTLTHALLGGSPAVNAGNPAAPGSSASACAPADQRGVARPFGPRCDIGAYETTEAVLTAQFGNTNYSASESDATGLFTVTLSAVSDFTVTVIYSTTLGTATPGADYVAATGTLTFTPGLTATQGAITLLPDLLDELDETIFVVITSTVNATLSMPTTTRLSLLDDDATPAMQWQSAAYTVTESAVTALLTATLSAPSSFVITATYTTTAGSAAAGSDYTAATKVLTFTAGSQITQASITLLPDLAQEPDETFTVTLTGPISATLGAPSAATVTILDNDTPPIAHLSAVFYNAPESATSVPFTVTLSAPSGLTVTVSYSTTSGSATPGADYTASTGVLTFTPDSQSAQGTIILLPDAAYELPAETFGLTLTQATSATLGAPVSAVVIIADDDAPPTAQFTGAAYLAAEADLTLPFTVTLSAAANVTVTVAYTTSTNSPLPGSATPGADYVHAAGVLTFTPGVTTTQGALTLLPDTLYEPTETFDLALGGPSNATLGTPSTATISIVEDDLPPTAQFSMANDSLPESATTRPFTVTLSGAASLTITVAYSTTAGSAAPGADFVHATGVLTFTPGLTATQGTVTLLPDLLDENDETLFVVITQTTIAGLGVPDTTRLIIVDDDAPPTVQWGTAAYNSAESATVRPLTATLSAPSSFTITVAYTTSAGSATPGADYISAAGVLTFTPGLTATQGTVTLLPDALDEADETFTVALGGPVSATLGAPATATVTLTDNDPTPTLQWSAAAYTTTEDAGSLTLTVTLSAASGLTVTVAYTSSAGTALAGDDYVTATGGLTFTPGQTTQTLTLTVLDDEVPEPVESLTLALGSPANATLSAPASATVTIMDEDGFRIYLPLVINPETTVRGYRVGRIGK